MRKNLPMLLIRVIVGVVFLTEGILKFVRPGELGAGRFAHIGIPYPHLLAPCVGVVEIAGGAALILNFFAGDAALLLLIVILTAIATTKLPILLGHHVGPFGPPKLDSYGVLGSCMSREWIWRCCLGLWRYFWIAGCGSVCEAGRASCELPALSY